MNKKSESEKIIQWKKNKKFLKLNDNYWNITKCSKISGFSIEGAGLFGSSITCEKEIMKS